MVYKTESLLWQNREASLRFYSTKLADMADGGAMQPVRRPSAMRSESQGRCPSDPAAMRTAARSKCLLMAVESGGRGFAGGGASQAERQR